MTNNKLFIFKVLQPKTWVLDIDGVIFTHNGHLRGPDKLLKNFGNFFKKINSDDYIILLTSRKKKFKKITESALKKYKIRYNRIVFNIPMGERILINDKKADGTPTVFSLNTTRNEFPRILVRY